jgi:Na+/H+ antiporter NhaD/arsenite permease-like protein
MCRSGMYIPRLAVNKHRSWTPGLRIVFFIGILLAVATLEHTHVLEMLAKWLDLHVGRQDVIVVLLGLLSAIVDNVPLVAASMGMYSLAQYPADSFLWEFIAYCAGTGGSILIIGSPPASP